VIATSLRSFTPALSLALFALGACNGAPISDEEIALGTHEAAVIDGNAADSEARPYEDMFVRVRTASGGTCSGTLIGSRDTLTASFVLTARHCFSSEDDASAVSVIRGETVRAAAIYFHPGYDDGSPTPDAALIELESEMSIPGPVYFTSVTPDRLPGVQMRCYGYGASDWVDRNGDGVYTKNEFTGVGRLRYADFEAIADTEYHFKLAVPNELGQALAPGDSGGPCFTVSGDESTMTNFVITGILKAGTVQSSDGVVRLNRETGATRISAWVRTFVPRT